MGVLVVPVPFAALLGPVSAAKARWALTILFPEACGWELGVSGQHRHVVAENGGICAASACPDRVSN